MAPVSPTPDAQNDNAFKGLVVSKPVVLDGRKVGTLIIKYDLQEISQRIWLYGSLVLGVLAVSSLFAVILSTRLRTVIASPILELAASATSVSRTKDYSTRARLQTPDEVGLLVKRIQRNAGQYSISGTRATSSSGSPT